MQLTGWAPGFTLAGGREALTSSPLSCPHSTAGGLLRVMEVEGARKGCTRPPLRRPRQPACLRGRPPLAPLAREAAALAGEVALPAVRAHSLAIQSRVPNTPATKAGT